MATPAESSSAADILAYILYLIARLEADAAVAAHAEVVQGPVDKLLKTLGVRNVAHNAVLKAEAKADFTRDKMLDALVPLALHTAATIGSKDSPVYGRIFFRTPIAFAAVPQKDLVKETGEVEKALKHETTPTAVLKHGAAFIEARKAWLAADEAESKAVDALKLATETIHAAKKDCIVATTRVRNRLGDHFAGESKKALRYFRKTKAKTKPAEVVATPVLPAPKESKVLVAVVEAEPETV